MKPGLPPGVDDAGMSGAISDRSRNGKIPLDIGDVLFYIRSTLLNLVMDETPQNTRPPSLPEVRGWKRTASPHLVDEIRDARSFIHNSLKRTRTKKGRRLHRPSCHKWHLNRATEENFLTLPLTSLAPDFA